MAEPCERRPGCRRDPAPRRARGCPHARAGRPGTSLGADALGLPAGPPDGELVGPVPTQVVAGETLPEAERPLAQPGVDREVEAGGACQEAGRLVRAAEVGHDEAIRR